MTIFERPFKHLKSVKLVTVVLVLILTGCDSCNKRDQRSQDLQPFLFGVIADVQYADKDDLIRDRGNRYFRASLAKLEECVAELNKMEPEFVIQLGDIIDGYSNDEEQSKKDMDQVMSIFNKLTMPDYHVIGNHCLHAGEETLLQKMNLERFYYDFTSPSLEEWRFVVLDGNDAGYGIISEEQYLWFQSVLQKASGNEEKVIVFCHYALLKESAKSHRMAEPEPLLKAMDETGVVAAWFAGHDHAGGYALREGVHHVTIKGMVEAVNNAYALIELHPEMIKINGFGDEPSRKLILQ